MKIISKNSSDYPRSGRYTPIRSVFDDFFGMPSLLDEFMLKPVYSTPLSFADVWEEGDDVKVKMAMPGVKKEDINIEVNRSDVTISANSKSEEKEDSKRKYLYRSMESSYRQSFNLPCAVDSSKAQAKYEDGVLLLTLPKLESEKPKQITVS